MKIVITGGAGFIGSALVRYLIAKTDHTVINIDKLSYASNPQALQAVSNNDRYTFYKTDIQDRKTIASILAKHQPDIIMHLAAETHVDRSISDAQPFIESNILGTYSLLEEVKAYWKKIKSKLLFHHISTDEVYGSLGETGSFSENDSYDPSSPYSASKASSDHLVRAWHKTYGLPVIVTNCSNNYGPYQYPEKLIPVVITRALKGEKIPVYGKGDQVRDWLYVDDHAEALYKVVKQGKVGETYNIGGQCEKKNIDVVYMICKLLDQLVQDKPANVKSFSDLINYVDDRPGHDKRYALDTSKIQRELKWQPRISFAEGLDTTVKWFLKMSE